MTDNNQTNSNVVSQETTQLQAQPTQEQALPTKGNAPVEIIRDGNTKVSIFKNERENFTGYALDPRRIYTDKDGKVREAKSFSPDEALKVARLLERGYDRVNEFKKQHQQQDKNRAPDLER